MSDEKQLKKIRKEYDLPEVVEVDVAAALNDKWQVSDGHKAIVDANTGKIFGIHSKGYRLARHEEGLLQMNNIIEQHPEFGKPEYTVVQYDDGRRAKVSAKFPEVEYPITRKKGDIVNPTLDYYNSYDKGWAEIIRGGAYRLVCANGLTVGEVFYYQKVVHFGEERPERFFVDLSESLHKFSLQVELWKKWADQELSIGQLESGVGLFTKKQQKQILEEADREKALSVWIFFNILTAMITHRVQSLRKQVVLEKRLRSLTGTW